MRDFRKFTFYVVYDIVNKQELSYVENIKEGTECVNRLMFFDYIDHFTHWCSLHNVSYDENDYESWKNSWKLYTAKCLQPNDFKKYKLVKIKATPKIFTELLRSLAQTVPLGCSYESQKEHTKFKNLFEKFKKEKEGN